MHSRRRILLMTYMLSVATVATVTLDCENGENSGSPPGDVATGSVKLAFSVPGSVVINEVSYAISGPTNVSNTVDVSQAQSSIEFVVGPLLAGSSYAITLSATDTAGDLCTSPATPFAVTTGVTTQLGVALVCTVGDGGFTFADAGSGSLEVDATVTVVESPPTVCPTVAGITISPAEETVGSTSAIVVTTEPAGATVQFAVASTDDAGSGNGIVSVTPTGTVFTCTSAGEVRLTVLTTAPLANDAGNCPEQSMSAFITCEP